MASSVKDKKGWRVTFYDANKVRRQFRVGGASKKQVETICNQVEAIVTCHRMGSPLSSSVASWLKSIGVDLHEKLSRVGLVEPRRSCEVLKFVGEYVEKRNDVKVATLKKWQSTVAHLKDYFPSEKRLDAVTVSDAEGFRRFLLRKGLSENTVRRYSGVTKQFFREAVKSRLISENPFSEVPAAVVRNSERFEFVDRKTCAKILGACPDSEWQVIFGLARFGGLRCPSEIVLLKWEDIDWKEGRFLVRSPKTEHHEGKDTRLVPLFPELRTLLETHKKASEGKGFVVGRYRNPTQNLRTMLLKIVERAGLEPWPKLFQNLRSSRQTELCDKFPSHVVSQWLGNSVTVANRHYLQVTDEHFQRASSEKVSAAIAEAAKPSGKVEIQVEMNTAEPSVMEAIPKPTVHKKSRENRGSASGCIFVHKNRMGDEGLEPPTSSL